MNELLQWGGHPVVHRLGWTLLHFLWQGMVVTGLFAFAHISQRKSSSNVRYGTGCVALLLMLAAPVITFVALGPERTMPGVLTIQLNPQLNPASPTTFSQTHDVLTPNVQRGPAAPPPMEISSVTAAPALNSEKFIRSLVLAWMLGVSTLTLRLLYASLHVARLKRRGSETLDVSWIERLDRLKAVLQISRPVRLVKSALVEVPGVVGWLRPVILLPAATLAGLTPAQLESILAHELAHIRRHDYLVNLLQNALETLLFYHPAVWWVSNCVRAEREICCDEIAVRVCGDRLVYAQALITLEQLRGGHSSLALGADGGSLLERICRLSGAPVGRNFPNRRRAGGVLIAALVAIIIVFVLHHPSNEAKARGSTASPDLTGTVRGPANQPITNAVVSIYAATPNVDRVESRSSDDCQKRATTDANGKFIIKALDADAYFRVLIVAKGFRPMFCYGVDPKIKTLDVTFKALSSGALPEERVRGRVVGPDGKPVSGALVNVYGAHREKEGWREPAWEDIDSPVFTDDAGGFVIHGQAPFISCDLSVEASGFAQSGRYSGVSTGGAMHEFRLTKGAALKGKLMKDGKPVANAGIGLSVVKTDVIDREFSVATDSEGRFSFVNIPPNREYYLFGIMRSLKERGALSARRVRLEGDGSSLDVGDLNLGPAFTLAGVLRLANGQPAPSNWTMTLCRTVMTPPPAGEPPPTGPGSREFLGLEYNFDNSWGKIGKNGEFHFSGVPAETVSLFFMVTSPYILSPRNASRDGRGYRLLGRMVTNKTDLVIEFEPNAPQPKSAPLDYQALSQKPLRGVEAWEKPPAATLQTNVETSMAPNPLTEWTGIVLLPNGQPAAGAQVGFAAPNEAIWLKGSKLSRSTGNEVPIASTDAQGRFSLPLMESTNSMDSADSLIAAHDGGYFKIEKRDLKVPLLIRLEAWGRIEGTLRVGKKPGTNEAILLAMVSSSPSSSILDTSDSWRRAGVGGRFVFEHVPPGKVRLCHMIRFGNGGGNSSGYTLARVKPGNVTKVEMGGDGRQVIGKAVKDSGVAFDWDQAVVKLHGPSPYQPDQPQFFCGPITDDGSFCVDDVPAGIYTLTFNVSSDRRNSRVIDLGILPAPVFTKDVKVPEVSDQRSDTPVDLGTLHIGNALNNAPSNPPPAIQPSWRGSSIVPSAINQAIVFPKTLAAIPNQTNAAAGPLNTSKPSINPSGSAGQATNLPGIWAVSGSVVDAETHQPIPEFTITPGTGPDPDLLHWQREIMQRGQNGRYHIELGGIRMNHYSIMAEAPGYLPEMVSWDALGGSSNGIAIRDFALRKGDAFSAQVVGLDGRAVEGAQAAYTLQWGGLQLDGHKIIAYTTNQSGFLYPGWQRSPVLNTDAQGHFTIPGMPGIQSLIIFDQDGFAQIPRETLDQARVIHLQPWTNAARVANEKGLKVRLKASKTGWAAGTVPNLTVGIRNEGAAKLLSSTNTRLWRMEVDGKWYRVTHGAGSLSEIKGDRSWTNGRVTLDGQWHRCVYFNFGRIGEAMYGQTDVWNDMGQGETLTLATGKHIIRLAVFAVEAAPDTVGTIEAVSNPVEFEMAALPAPAVKPKTPVPSSSSKPVTNSLGLTLEIRCTTNVLKVGDEIPIEFLIRNHGTEDYKYSDRNYDRGGRMGEFKLVAKTASGESVPDARLHFQPGIAGGLGQLRLLHSGESFSKVIALNLWALIKEPGRYEVVGIYGYDPGYDLGYGKSEPISISVLPRTKAEIHDYIQGLTNNVGPPGMSEDLVKKLMYTYSPEIVPVLLKVMSTEGGNAKFWAAAALADYVPHNEGSRKAILEAATKYGLNGTGLEPVLLAHEFDNKQMKPIIERALAADNSGEWGAGVWLALRHFDAAFTPRLIAIAGDSKARWDTRSIAMRMLISNRTDAGVKAIKALLKNPAPEMLNPWFEAIANGYSGQGKATAGTPVTAEDFSAEDMRPLIERLLTSTNQTLQLQLSGVLLAKRFGSDALTAQLVALTTNPALTNALDFQKRAGAVYALALNRTDEGVKTLKTLLSDPDPKVSKMAEEAIRNAYTSRGDARGRPLRADDFDAKFKEPEATPTK